MVIMKPELFASQPASSLPTRAQPPHAVAYNAVGRRDSLNGILGAYCSTGTGTTLHVDLDLDLDLDLLAYARSSASTAVPDPVLAGA